jgi:hypothetical protein
LNLNHIFYLGQQVPHHDVVTMCLINCFNVASSEITLSAVASSDVAPSAVASSPFGVFFIVLIATF